MNKIKRGWLTLLIIGSIALTIVGALVCLRIYSPSPAERVPLKKSNRSETMLRSIHANQTMIARFQGEFDSLLSEQEKNPSEKTFLRLANLKNKIAVLIQENSQFLEALSKEK